jgi:RNA polymerase sigma-70 factor (ECF subfamily)
MTQNPKLSLDQIWSQYRRALQSYLHQRVADPDDVSDLLQQVLIRTHAALPSLRETDSLRPWLFRIARNVSIDFYRNKARDKDINPEDLWYNQPEADVLSGLEPCLKPFINSLPTEKAALLTAIDLGGQSQKDFAAGSGDSYSTVKSRVQSARQDLRRLFDQCCALTITERGDIVDVAARNSDCPTC